MNVLTIPVAMEPHVEMFLVDFSVNVQRAGLDLCVKLVCKMAHFEK